EASDQGHGTTAPECRFPCPSDCGRYIEIWNLVFMQYDRQPRVPDGTLFELNPLPKLSIDTGMGLERVTAVLQGVISNYETDLFVPLIEAAARFTHSSSKDPKSIPSLRIIADHSRAATFLISDGVIPSNEGRGYVLRKILRRAIRHGRLLNFKSRFLSEMAFQVRDLMESAYPELMDNAPRVAKVIDAEEARFAHTLGVGLAKLEDLLEYSIQSQKTQNAV